MVRLAESCSAEAVSSSSLYQSNPVYSAYLRQGPWSHRATATGILNSQQSLACVVFISSFFLTFTFRCLLAREEPVSKFSQGGLVPEFSVDIFSDVDIAFRLNLSILSCVFVARISVFGMVDLGHWTWGSLTIMNRSMEDVENVAC